MNPWSLPGKLVYLANRHPRLSRSEFRDRWIRHGSVGDAMADSRLESSVSSLRYCLNLDRSDVLPSATNEHDGVALLSLRSVVSIPTVHAMLTQNDIAFADELRTFERPVEEVTMYAASELLVDGSETDVVVLELARRRAGVGPVEFFRQADADREHRLTQTQLVARGLRRWVRNVVIAPAARGFGYDAVNEYWFDSVDAVADASDAIEDFLETSVSNTERRASTVMVTTVIHRLGRDRP